MIISFIFIAREITKLDITNIHFEDPARSFFYVFLFSIAFVVSVCIGAYGWGLILQFINGSHIDYHITMPVYTKANVAKYLPGNVMHYASRNVLGNKLGWKHGNILLSSILEVILIFLSAAIFSAIFAHQAFIDVVKKAYDALNKKGLGILIPILIILLVGIIIYILTKPKYAEKIKRYFTFDFLKLFLKTFFIYTATFIIMGAILIGIYKGVLGYEMTLKNAMTIFTASVLSWFAGFITPGAPGGLGVKESIMILMLSPAYGREATLMAALIHRLASIIGDLLAFVVGIVVDKRKNQVE